jgi:hypothetical protein
VITDQQKKLAKYMCTKTIKEWHELTGMSMTKVYQVMGCRREMKASEYFSVFNIYRDEIGINIHEILWFGGLDE